MQNITHRKSEIIKLHAEIKSLVKTTVETAIRIGELLTEQKEAMPHGEFTPWIRESMPFTDRTARNYMKLYQNRDRLKTETVSDLTGAYRLLSDSETEDGLDISRIDPNPYLEQSPLAALAIPHWTNVIKDMGAYWTLAVRRNRNRFQLIADHDRWAAMKLCDCKQVNVSIVDLSDKQMQAAAEFEMKSAQPTTQEERMEIGDFFKDR